MPATQPPLSTILPPLICGTGTFNNLYSASVADVPTNAIVERALDLGVRAFDTSPYYGPAEELLGNGLSTPSVLKKHPRSTYRIVTKVGRIADAEFDYSAEWVRYSIARSLKRLHTTYLDVVYCHDVEFVSQTEVLVAIKELRRIRDEEGTIKYIGVSGFPVPYLCDIAELVLKETGEPLDAVLSYANFTLQNMTLASLGLERLKKAGVSSVPNASILGMGLLRSKGIPVGGKGDFHPAPEELREKCIEAARYVDGTGEKLEVVSIRWALDTWSREGAGMGGVGGIGVSVFGASNIEELEETMSVWESVLDGLPIAGREVTNEKKEWSLARAESVAGKAKAVSGILGQWKDFAWPSPAVGYVNVRTVMGVFDDVASLPLVTDGFAKDSRL